MENDNQITPWIPVIGTLCGAVFGLLASFLIAFFNRNNENTKEKDERDRKRLERIYELLVSIKSERTMHMAELMNCVHSGTPVKEYNNENPTLAPIVELEMLIKLYFPLLEDIRQSFMAQVHELGSFSLNVRSTDYSSTALELKQKETGRLWIIVEKINKEVKTFQSEISKIIKA